MSDAYPMYEKCVKHQQVYVPYLTEANELSHIVGMLLLDNGERSVPIMSIKYYTDEILDLLKCKMDFVEADVLPEHGSIEIARIE